MFSLYSKAQTSASTASDSDKILLNAESVRSLRVNNKNTVVLKGNVHVVFGDNSIRCKEARIQRDTGELEAIGDIYYISPNATMAGDRLTLNYKTKIGTLYNGVIKMDQVIFEGEVIHKKGEKEFEVIQADYTACTTCPPAWGFSGTRVDAVSGGYAHIRNAVLKVVKVPVFWFPYLIVPLNSRRQTGLLVPGFGFSAREGFIYDQPLFWVIDDSQDATVTGRYYQRRGILGTFNYRYVLTDKSSGSMDVGYIRDKLLSQDQTMKDTGYEDKKINRWHYRYRHSYFLPGDFIHKVDLKMASDLRYARDFKKELPGWGDPALDNRMSLTKNTEGTHTSLDTSVYVNQIKENPISDNRDAVHRFPEMKYALLPMKLGDTPFMFNMDARYNNFARDSYNFDDRKIYNNTSIPEEEIVDGQPIDRDRVGVYNEETDLVRTGQRFDITPRISAPLSLGPYIDLLPSASYRETDYQFSLGKNKNVQRRLFRTDVSARTRFSRIFGDLEDPEATRYRHEIVPEISHTSIPWVKRQAHSFFGTTDQESFFTSNTALNDTDNLQFDYHDRLYERNLFTFSLSNYLIRKRKEKGADDLTYNQIVLFRLSQSYDYWESIKKTDPRQPWSDISALLDVRLDYFETNTLVRYYPYQNLSSTTSRVKGIHPKGHFLEFTYSQDFIITKGSRFATSRTEDLITTAGVVVPYVTLLGRTAYSFVTKKYNTYGYTIILTPPGNCWNIELGQDKTDYDTSYHFTASFLFDGKKATSIRRNDEIM